MRASRAYLAGLGTAGSLVIGTILLFTVGSAVVAFHGWRPLGIGSPATQTLQARQAKAREHRAQVAPATAAFIHPPGAAPSALTGVAALPASTPDGLIATLPGRVRVGGGRGHKVGVSGSSGSHRHAATRRGHARVTTAPTSTTPTTPTPTSPTAAAPTPTPSTTAPVAATPSQPAPVSHPAPPVRVTVPAVSRPINPPRHGVPSILNKIGSVVSKRHPVTRPTASLPTPPPVQHPIPHPGPPPGPHLGPPTASHGPHGPGPHGPGPHGPGPSPLAAGPPPGLIGRPSPPPIGVPSPGQGLHHPGPPPGIGAGGNGPPGHGFGRSRG